MFDDFGHNLVPGPARRIPPELRSISWLVTRVSCFGVILSRCCVFPCRFLTSAFVCKGRLCHSPSADRWRILRRQQSSRRGAGWCACCIYPVNSRGCMQYVPFISISCEKRICQNCTIRGPSYAGFRGDVPCAERICWDRDEPLLVDNFDTYGCICHF